MAKKIAEVRMLPKTGPTEIVHIKMNRGGNFTLRDSDMSKFVSRQAAYMCDGNSHSEASLLAANDFLEGRL